MCRVCVSGSTARRRTGPPSGGLVCPELGWCTPASTGTVGHFGYRGPVRPEPPGAGRARGELRAATRQRRRVSALVSAPAGLEHKRGALVSRDGRSRRLVVIHDHNVASVEVRQSGRAVSVFGVPRTVREPGPVRPAAGRSTQRRADPPSGGPIHPAAGRSTQRRADPPSGRPIHPALGQWTPASTGRSAASATGVPVGADPTSRSRKRWPGGAARARACTARSLDSHACVAEVVGDTGVDGLIDQLRQLPAGFPGRGRQLGRDGRDLGGRQAGDRYPKRRQANRGARSRRPRTRCAGSARPGGWPAGAGGPGCGPARPGRPRPPEPGPRPAPREPRRSRFGCGAGASERLRARDGSSRLVGGHRSAGPGSDPAGIPARSSPGRPPPPATAGRGRHRVEGHPAQTSELHLGPHRGVRPGDDGLPAGRVDRPRA